MKKYLITSPEFYTDSPLLFAKKLETQMQKHTPDFVLLRDKETSNYKSLATAFIQVLNQHPKVKAFLHEDFKLAKELNASGVHLSGKSFSKIKEAKKQNLEVIVSTHTYDEVLEAEKLGADYVTYSPIFDTPNKGKPKGVKELTKLLKLTKMKIFALGGIVSDEQINVIKETQVYGFASIRYFFLI